MRCGPYDSDSPRPHIGFGTGAQLRPQAPCLWRHGMAPQTQAKTKDNDGFPRVARTDCGAGDGHSRHGYFLVSSILI